jgi:hypothetical protein
MGARGAIILSFFGAIFAALTLVCQLGWTGPAIGLPFLVFIAVLLAALRTLRLPGTGISPSGRGGRVILWSTLGEGFGLVVSANLVVQLGHADLLVPTVALVVGLHFLPMGRWVPFPPFYGVGTLLICAALAGFAVA